jgi:hypothetical protein
MANTWTPIVLTSEWIGGLSVGDEFLIGKGKARGIYAGTKKGKPTFYMPDADGTALTTGESIQEPGISFYLYRSGKRNLLEVKAGNITSLSDPTTQVLSTNTETKSKTYIIPQK